MNQTRIDMLDSLKRITTPLLRELGFKGSGQNFYRVRDGHIDLLTFQFSVFSGRLISEISYVTKDGKNTTKKELLLTPAKLRVAMTGERLRLGKKIKKKDPWFVYDNALEGEELESPDKISATFSDLINTEGEQWWRSSHHIA